MFLSNTFRKSMDDIYLPRTKRIAADINVEIQARDEMELITAKVNGWMDPGKPSLYRGGWGDNHSYRNLTNTLLFRGVDL